MIFLTVGTLKPFDRLVMKVDELAGKGIIKEKVFAQIGIGAQKPENFEWIENLDKNLFDDIVGECSYMISHAGMGSILAGLNNRKPMLVMPRLHRFGEIINDHQLSTAEKFEELGHVLAVYRAGQIAEKVGQLKSFIPQTRQVHVEKVIERISNFLENTV